MKTKCFLLFTCFSFLSLFVFSQKLQLSQKTKAALKKVDKERIRKDIAYLADDKLKGRLPGEKGYQMAVDYVVDQYKQMGLTAAGDNGTYLQKLILRKASLNASRSTAVLKDLSGNEDSLAIGREILIVPGTLKNETQVSARLVFVGYGIDIPGKYSDYEGIDVKGKIVVFISGSPAGLDLPSSIVSHFANAASKMEIAASKGAAGSITVLADTFRIRSNSAPITVAMNPERTIAYGRSVAGNLPIAARVTFNVLKRLMFNTGKNVEQIIAGLKKAQPASFELPLFIQLHSYSTFKDQESYNVVGKIEGGDKELKNEYVVHTAHLDHLGVGGAVNGDSIYNGAHDNASGVAAILEIARTYKQMGAKPRRSVIIAAVTGEEMGLLGSSYFVANPPVPKSQIVAGINSDMPTLIAPLLSVTALGAEHSSLAGDVAFACKQLGLEVEKDPMPEENRFIRSDQYSFVLQGIPALNIKYGTKTTDPSFDLVKFTKEWRDKNYHKPSDEITNNFDFDAAIKYVQVYFLTSYSIAQTTARPKWNEGDLFGKNAK